jgi:hypothetical protein
MFVTIAQQLMAKIKKIATHHSLFISHFNYRHHGKQQIIFQFQNQFIMKKLKLNKQTIAQLTNPDRVFGGEGDDGQQSNYTCPGPKTCVISGDPLCKLGPLTSTLSFC